MSRKTEKWKARLAKGSSENSAIALFGVGLVHISTAGRFLLFFFLSCSPGGCSQSLALDSQVVCFSIGSCFMPGLAWITIFPFSLPVPPFY
jgi:hypothetical protein